VPYDRVLGGAPALTDAEVDDVVAFLRTLSDGFRR
jgi:cytochrome c peroxidase